jgi:cyanophycin synthetase
MTCTEGIEIDGRIIDRGDCSGPQSARAVLANPRVEAAVLEKARGGILREGLAFDWCDVGIVTNIGEGDHLGLNEILTLEKLAQVKRTVIDSVGTWGTGVLKADDPLTASMAEYCPGPVTYFARDHNDPVIASHRAGGGKAVFVRDGVVILAEGERESPLIPLSRVPLTHGGRIGFQVENVLAASAAAWALGVPLAALSDALVSFVGDSKTTPGRFNVFHHEGSTIVVDYGHNPSALYALGEALNHFPHERRSIVFTVAGDRRDEDIVRQGTIIGDLFDMIVLYEDTCTRGRADGVVVSLMRQGLEDSTRVTETHETRGEINAIDLALNALRPGDLLVIQADTIDQTLRHVQDVLERRVSWTEPVLASAGLNTVSVVYSE